MLEALCYGILTVMVLIAFIYILFVLISHTEEN